MSFLLVVTFCSFIPHLHEFANWHWQACKATANGDFSGRCLPRRISGSSERTIQSSCQSSPKPRAVAGTSPLQYLSSITRPPALGEQHAWMQSWKQTSSLQIGGSVGAGPQGKAFILSSVLASSALIYLPLSQSPWLSSYNPSPCLHLRMQSSFSLLKTF